MTTFNVRITREDPYGEPAVTQIYQVRDDLHDDKAIRAAEKALKTFREHGHGRFPYDDATLIVHVEEQNGEAT